MISMDTNVFARSLPTDALGTNRRYDVVVVGARVAGAATAMLLARRGFHVAVVDRSQYGSDTLSTHALMRPAVAQLHRWGLLGAVADSGAPPIRRTTFHYGDEVVPVDIKARGGFDAFYAPRRTVLDRIVVDAARVEGVEFHFGARVEGVLRDEHDRVAGVHGRDDRGAPFEIRAAITVGADGARSRIARDVEAPITRRGSATTAVVY
jgi:2-polyprenyl-6-methoxyphenol hydroxylase-like FAD-dependent oxidoreductase